jgi:hypothetical protein
MKELPYFKFYCTEWMTGKIVFESLEMQGLFINICALYWKNAGLLSIYEIEQRYKKKTLIEKLSGRFFSVNDGFISIRFLDEQLIDRQELSKRNSKNGLLGGRPSPEKEKATAKPTQSDDKPKKSNIELEREEERERYIKWFDAFWELYDKKEGKKKSLAKWMKLTEKEIEQILQHVPKYVKSTPDVQFRKDPLTYLNGNNWEDEIINRTPKQNIQPTTIQIGGYNER